MDPNQRGALATQARRRVRDGTLPCDVERLLTNHDGDTPCSLCDLPIPDGETIYMVLQGAGVPAVLHFHLECDSIWQSACNRLSKLHHPDSAVR